MTTIFMKRRQLKVFSFVWTFIIALSLFRTAAAQETRIAQQINQKKGQGQTFPIYQMFAFNPNANFGSAAVIKDYSGLKLNSLELKRLLTDKPACITLSIPTKNGKVEVELQKNKLLADGFKVTTSSSGEVAYTPGLYYQGAVKGASKSLAAISFFQDEVIGVVSTTEGNFNLGKMQNPNGELVYQPTDYVWFNGLDLVNQQAFNCNVTTPENYQMPQLSKNYDPIVPFASIDKIVKTYFVCDNAFYVSKGSNTTTASNYISAIYNDVATIYLNEDINTQISQIFVYTTADPYSGISAIGDILDAFEADMGNTFNGDLAHLVSTRDLGGGLAYLDVLCDNANLCAVSGNISSNYTAFPNYSFTVNVVTHEMGHNVGSPHTHSCTWPGGAIDNCASPEGACSAGPNPGTNGGTIMSYCHLNVGISFANGFGPLPGALIRDRVSNAACLAALSPFFAFSSSTPSLVEGEGDAGTTQYTYTVNLQPASAGSTSVQVLVGGTATLNTDYSISPAPSGNIITLNFSPGTTTQDIVITVNGDLPFESDETINLTLQNPTGGPGINIGQSVRTHTIFDDDIICTASSTICGSPDADYINQVSINDLSKLTGTSCGTNGYSDFSAMSTTLVIGNTYSIDIGLGLAFSNEVCSAFFDWNNDLDFNDANESLVLSGGPFNFTGNVVVPAGAFEGTIRMRVRCQDGSPVLACGESSTGEIEDYSLIVTSTPQGYCGATSASCGGGVSDYISNVNLGSINKSSTSTCGSNGYSDFTAFSTTLAVSSNTTLTVTNGTAFSNEVVSAFFDWNGDFDFDDAGESLILTGTQFVKSGTVSVPANATNGAKRMRVRCKSSGTVLACGGTANGEIEDYTINVTGGCSNPTVSISPGSSTICAGGSASLTASGATTYVWNPGNLSGASQNLSPATTTTYTVTGTSGACTGTTTVTVTVNSLPTVGVSGTTTICAGGSASLTASGATTYVWNPGNLSGASQNLSPASTTTYTVTGTTGACTGTTTVTVTVNSAPNVQITGPSVVCQNVPTILTASGASTYLWAPGGQATAAITINPQTQTTYTVTGTAAGGCTDTEVLTVSVNPTPVIDFTGSVVTVNVNENVSLFANVTNAIGAIQYSWEGPNAYLASGNSQQIMNAQLTDAGIYTLTVLDEGTSCGNSATIEVTVSAGCTAPVVSVNATVNPVCFGGSSSLTASGADTYVWEPGGLTGATINVNSASFTTSYTVTGTVSGGCTATTEYNLIVRQPFALSILGMPSISCAGQPVTLIGGGAVSYNWQPGNLSGASVQVNPTSTTTYTLTGTDENGCTTMEVTTISVNPLPTVQFTVAPAVNVTQNDVVTYTLDQHYDAHDWTIVGGTVQSGGGNLDDFVTVLWNNVGAASVSVVVEDINVCTGSLEFNLTVNSGCTSPNIQFTGNSAICQGGNAIITALGADSYLWQPGGMTTQTINVSPNASTTYTVTGTVAGGCSATATFALTVNLAPIINTSGSTSAVIEGNAISLNASVSNPVGALSYSWSGPNGYTATTQNPVISNSTLANSGAYVVTVIDAGTSCSATATVNVTVSPAAPQPTLSFTLASASANEGNSGSTAYQFTVTLANASTFPVVAKLNPSGSGAFSNGSGGDWWLASGGGSGVVIDATGGTITFSANGNRSFNLLVYGDGLVESDETATLTLVSQTAGVTVSGTAAQTRTILNDDAAATANLNFAAGTPSTATTEGNSGTKLVPIQVTLSGANSFPVVAQISYSGTATFGNTFGKDFHFTGLQTGNQLTFTANGTKTFNVVVMGDVAVEADETVNLTLSSNPTTNITDGSRVITITNDDAPRMGSDLLDENEAFLSVYPNPAREALNISILANETSVAEIQIIDMTGRVVIARKEDLIEGRNLLTFDLSNEANGLYQIAVKMKDYQESFKIVKQ